MILPELHLLLSATDLKKAKNKLIEFNEVFEQLTENTKKAYHYDLQNFISWCTNNKIMVKHDLSHNKNVLKAYFNWLIEQSVSRSTITRKKAPVSKFLKVLDLPNPFRDVMFNDWLMLALKQKPAFQHQALALTHDLLLNINGKLDEKCPLQLRDKLVLNIMFDGLLRASELCSLKCGDISVIKKSIFISSSKTDQESRGSYRALSRTSIQLIELWKTNYDVRSGFLLRSLTPSKKVTLRGLKYSAVYETYKRLSKLVDIDDNIFTTHSARVGGAVTLAEHNCNLLEIQHAGGWKTSTMPARYTEQTSIHNSGMGNIMKKLGR